MVSKKKITISWSGGKDSAFALYKILLSGEYQIEHLHTVINKDTRRVGMHGIREELIDNQAEAIGINVKKLYLETADNHEAYEQLMISFYKQCAKQGIESVVFGDLFLVDLKEYRERLLKLSGVTGVYPLWELDTEVMLGDFLNTGFKTLICAANAKYFSEKHIGKTIDDSFIGSLPQGVDPCGENGEFHTFVYDGPIFKKPMVLQLGEIAEKQYNYTINANDKQEVVRTVFLFQDLIL